MINRSARKFEETILIGQSNIPNKPIDDDNTNEEFIITTDVAQKSFKNRNNKKENII